MAAPLIQFEVAGEVQLARSFSRFGDSASDLRPAFTGIADNFQTIEERLFETEGRTGGRGAWAPLSQAYAARKAQVAPGKTILRLSDRLWRSLTGRDRGDAIREIKRQQMRLGTRVPWALFHQDARSGRTKRRVIDLNEGNKRDWTKIVQRQLVDVAKREGLLAPTSGALARGGARTALGQ